MGELFHGHAPTRKIFNSKSLDYMVHAKEDFSEWRTDKLEQGQPGGTRLDLWGRYMCINSPRSGLVKGRFVLSTHENPEGASTRPSLCV